MYVGVAWERRCLSSFFLSSSRHFCGELAAHSGARSLGYRVRGMIGARIAMAVEVGLANRDRNRAPIYNGALRVTNSLTVGRQGTFRYEHPGTTR